MKTTQKHWIALTASTLGLTGLSLASGFGDEKYTYDASGNVSEKQIGDQITRYTYTGNQLNGSESDSGSKQYAYDSSGRLTSDFEAGKSIRKIEHQYLDKVTKVQNGDKTTEFFYNAEGQLVATNTAGTSETFAWDGLAMVNRGEELYVNEAHTVGGVSAIVGNEVAVSDIIGSSLSVGIGSFESSAFGEGLTEGLFTGKPFIAELDAFLFKYRNYSAEDLRWKSADPSGYPDGSNNFTYVSGNPITKIDPMGLTESEIVKIELEANNKKVNITIAITFDQDVEPEPQGLARFDGNTTDNVNTPPTWTWTQPSLVEISSSIWTPEYDEPVNESDHWEYRYTGGDFLGGGTLVESGISFPDTAVMSDYKTEWYEEL